MRCIRTCIGGIQVAVNEEEGSLPGNSQAVGVQSALLSRLLQAAVAAKVTGSAHAYHAAVVLPCTAKSQLSLHVLLRTVTQSVTLLANTVWDSMLCDGVTSQRLYFHAHHSHS